MLSELSIRDVVLIDKLTLTLAPGLNVLTGETGAGKSILLDSLGLALGARADSGLVRAGAAQGSVAARFDLPADHPVRDLLGEQGITIDGDEIVLRRVIQADGKSRAFIDDEPVGVALLRRAGALLVEIHGQNEEQGLLDAGTHRAILDSFAGLGAVLAEVRRAHAARQTAEDALAAAELSLAKVREDEDYARHMLAELDRLDPELGEEAALAAQRTALQSREKIVDALADAEKALSDGGGVEAKLRVALRAVERVADKAGGALDAVRDCLDRCLTEAGEAGAALARAGRDLDADPQALEKLEERLFALRAAARKHNVAVDQLATVRDDFKRRLAMIEDGGAALDDLARRAAAAGQDYATAAAALSKGRAKAAQKLDRAVAAELGPLKLGAAKFVTAVETLTPAQGGPDGCDRVTFTIATNPGSAPGPLAKIASGGELSRLMLALKVVLAGQSAAISLVFDEVDRGVGGATAAAVGERLARLASAVQVLVVTHSPQVAALGQRHFQISKQSPNRKETVTRVAPLGDETARIEEIARMLAGAEVTEAARAAARSLRGEVPVGEAQA